MTPSSAKISLRDETQLGILLAAALALRLMESSLAFLLPLPGAHLGLANTVTIIVLYLYGTRKAALFLAARLLLTGLLFTGLLTPSFLIGLSGAVVSFVAMALTVRSQWFSTVGVGLLGAFFTTADKSSSLRFLCKAPLFFPICPSSLPSGFPQAFSQDVWPDFSCASCKKQKAHPLP